MKFQFLATDYRSPSTFLLHEQGSAVVLPPKHTAIRLVAYPHL